MSEPKCAQCHDTGLYDACCRPHRCDCGAYELVKAQQLELDALRKYEKDCGKAVLTQLGIEKDYMLYLFGEMSSDTMPELKTALEAWYEARRATRIRSSARE
jgi:hypothetical protein